MKTRSQVQKSKIALITWWATWPTFHLGLVLLPDWFFKHVLLGLSVYAIISVKRDDLRTTEQLGKEDQG